MTHSNVSCMLLISFSKRICETSFVPSVITQNNGSIISVYFSISDNAMELCFINKSLAKIFDIYIHVIEHKINIFCKWILFDCDYMYIVYICMGCLRWSIFYLYIWYTHCEYNVCFIYYEPCPIVNDMQTPTPIKKLSFWRIKNKKWPNWVLAAIHTSYCTYYKNIEWIIFPSNQKRGKNSELYILFF